MPDTPRPLLWLTIGGGANPLFRVKMPLSAQVRIPFTPPMECLPVAIVPEGVGWVYELKLDGYRAQAIRDSTGVRLLSRRGKDLTKKYPFVSRDLLDAIKVGTALDGELVA